jgi:hypothetical protein
MHTIRSNKKVAYVWLHLRTVICSQTLPHDHRDSRWGVRVARRWECHLLKLACLHLLEKDPSSGQTTIISLRYCKDYIYATGSLRLCLMKFSAIHCVATYFPCPRRERNQNSQVQRHTCEEAYVRSGNALASNCNVIMLITMKWWHLSGRLHDQTANSEYGKGDTNRTKGGFKTIERAPFLE